MTTPMLPDAPPPAPRDPFIVAFLCFLGLAFALAAVAVATPHDENPPHAPLCPETGAP